MTVSDAFDNFVVFSELQWIGTQDENPEEEALPWPSHMLHVWGQYNTSTPGRGARVVYIRRLCVVVGYLITCQSL